MSALVIVLNYVCCLLFTLAAMRRFELSRETSYVELFESFFAGSLLFCVQTFFFVEFLSLGNLLKTPGPLVAAYFGSAIILSATFFRWRSHLKRRPNGEKTDSDMRPIRRTGFFIALLIILPLLFIAVYYPPCTADSMSYHLPRICHWIQNGNVSAYPTNYMRQLYVQPFAEYLILPWELMTDSDYFDNTIQIVALIGILFLTALMIRHFGGGGWAQTLGTAIVLGSPLVIFEAPTTQTDLVVTFFFFCFLYSGLKLCTEQNGRNLLFYSLCMGASLGLGLNTKVSVAAFELPFCFLFGWRFFQVHRRRVVFVYAMLVAGFLLFNVPYFARNWLLVGNPFGVPEMQLQMRNGRFGPDVVFSNAVRNVGMQMLTPVVNINDINLWFVMQCHESFGIRWGDPDTTFTGVGTVPYPYEPNFLLDDYRSGNTLIILLFTIVSLALGGAALKRLLFPDVGRPLDREKIPRSEKRKKKAEPGVTAIPVTAPAEPNDLFCRPNCPAMQRELAVFTWFLFFGFLLFCGLFRWQPFGARLLLPVLLGTIPFISLGLCRILEPKRIVQMTVLILGISLLFVVFVTANSLFFNPIESLIDFDRKSVETTNTDTDSQANLVNASESVSVPVPEMPGTENLADITVSIKNVELLEDYFNPSRSFVEQFRFRRNYKYFRTVKNYLIDYIAISDQIIELDVTNIGLALDPMIDRWEYPFWPIIRSRNPRVCLKWVVFPEYLKKTRNYDPDFVPDVIITDYDVDAIQSKFTIEHAWKFRNLVLLKIKKDGNDAPPKDTEMESTETESTETEGTETDGEVSPTPEKETGNQPDKTETTP